MEFDLRQRITASRLQQFAEEMIKVSQSIEITPSARGWAYIMETMRLVNKDEFDQAEKYINEAIKRGYIPVDIVGVDEERKFSGVEFPTRRTPREHVKKEVAGVLRCERWYTPDWWEGEEYYIQMIVEKGDLKRLFEPACEIYHIPIASSKGWASVAQRAEYAKRFKEAEEKGLKCVLLYCGDHDPDGLRISGFLRKNLKDVENLIWQNGTTGYNPENLIIDRFGLNYEFIIKHKLTWIDNLLTSRKKNLASPGHRNFKKAYVQNYLKEVGERKCEANALVPIPKIARKLVTDAIEKYLGRGAENRFYTKWFRIKKEMDSFREETGLNEAINNIMESFEDEE